jgi:hypothetical protein
MKKEAVIGREKGTKGIIPDRFKKRTDAAKTGMEQR